MPQPGNPQSLNRYSYTINNPQRYIDPSGYNWFTDIFKAIGDFFKSIFKNPAQFLVTVAVGIATGGAAWAAAGPLFGITSAMGQAAFAFGVGGFFAGGVGSVMAGGSFWKGAIIGGISGAVGGAVGAWAAGGGPMTFGSGLAGAVAGGATAGALGTAFYGGKFAVNFFSGGITAGLVYGVGAGLAKLSEAGATQGTAQPLSTTGLQSQPESQPASASLNMKLESSSGPSPQPDSPVTRVGEVIPFPEGGRPGPRPDWMPPDPRVLPFPQPPAPSAPFAWPEPFPLIVPNVPLFRNFLDTLIYPAPKWI